MNEQLVREATEELYKVNAMLSIHANVIKKTLGIADVEELNLVIGSIIKKLRAADKGD
jgi:hypothetical protein